MSLGLQIQAFYEGVTDGTDSVSPLCYWFCFVYPHDDKCKCTVV